MSYLGYFAPTYLKCIDGWIGDETLFGSLEESHKKAHKLITIKGGYMGYEDSIKIKPKRDSDKTFKFGCFNHSRKLSNETVKLFCSVLITVKMQN